MKCLLCDHTARTDNLIRHVIASHPCCDATFSNIQSNHPCLKRAANPNVVYKTAISAITGGQIFPEGLCLACGHCVHNAKPSKTAAFDEHACKSKQVRQKRVATATQSSSVMKAVKSNGAMSASELQSLIMETTGNIDLCVFNETCDLDMRATIQNLLANKNAPKAVQDGGASCRDVIADVKRSIKKDTKHFNRTKKDVLGLIDRKLEDAKDEEAPGPEPPVEVLV